MEQDERHKYIAGLTFRLLVLLMVCMAAIGILQLFTVLSRTINL